MSSIQPVYSIQVVFEGKEVGVLKDVKPNTTFKKLRFQILGNLDDDNLPPGFRMKLNDDSIIEKSKEKDVFSKFQKENILEIIDVIENPDIHQKLSYKMGGVSIKEKKKTSSVLFQENVTAMKDYKTLPFPLVFDMVKHSLQCFGGGLFPWLSFIYLLIQTDYWYLNTNGKQVLSRHNNKQAAVGWVLYCIPIFFASSFMAPFITHALTKVPFFKNKWNSGYGCIYIFVIFLFLYYGIINFEITSKEENYAGKIIGIYFLLMDTYTFIYIYKLNHKYKYQILKWFLLNATLGGICNLIFPKAWSGVKDDMGRSIVLVVAFLVREIVLTINRSIARSISDTADMVLLKMILIFFSLFTRFLFGSMKTMEGVTTSLLLNGFVELVSRQTHGFKDKLLHQVIAKFRGKKEGIHTIETTAYKRFRVRYIFLEMQTEFIAIIATPITMLVFYKQRLFFNMNYGGYNDPLDGWLYVYVLVASLLLEIVVDVLCLKVEMDFYKYPVLEEWNNRYKEYTFMMMFLSITAFTIFETTFNEGKLTPSCFCDCIQNSTYSMQIEYCEQWVNVTTG